MKPLQTAIPDVRIFELKEYDDERGFFLETWSQKSLSAAGLNVAFVQDNHSRSHKGVVRGLHYQIVQPQGKLIRVSNGRAFVAAVDLRRSSATFGQSVVRKIVDQNRLTLWIPEGFAFGFLALENKTEISYKCTDFYAPQHERVLLWNDPALRIAWPLDGLEPILAARDRDGIPLARADTYP